MLLLATSIAFLLGFVANAGAFYYARRITTPRSCHHRTMICHHHQLAKSSNSANTDIGDENTSTISDEQVLWAMERLEALDAKLGTGCGASKERAKLQTVIDQWDQEQLLQQMSETVAQEGEGDDDEGCDDDNDDDDDLESITSWDDNKFVSKHASNDRVAIFGGDPARRRHQVEKKLAPYQSLDQYGTPRDVGPHDTTNLLKKVDSSNYDVVYLWTRFNCHSSRAMIREACVQTGTRFEEVESLAYIRDK